jgi:hypothetical protein
MPNRASIEAYQRVNVRTDHVSYFVHIYDDFDETIILFADKKDIPDDDMELLQVMIRAKHNTDEHAGSAEVIERILDRVYDNSLGMYVGSIKYDWSDIKYTLCQDIREVYYCYKCGWESYSDVDYEADCGQSDCDGEMTEVKDEWYER